MKKSSTIPKRLIEVDLPIRKISLQARREKSVRHGHISTLHLWWARRPLAACRAVVLASLWPDPADPNCPKRFREEAARVIRELRGRVGGPKPKLDEGLELRAALLDFIAEFSNWDLAGQRDYLEASRTLVRVAHETLEGKTSRTRPLVVDPFAGGGAIPVEALRVGAEAFASDLNPIAVLLNKVAVEFVPKYGDRLTQEVRRASDLVQRAAESELASFYPRDSASSAPIAYLWARTIKCEGPGCGAEIPLVKSLWLAKRSSRSIAMKFLISRDEKRVDIEVISGASAKDVGLGTVRNGAATCPVCGYTTPNPAVRNQLAERRGGASTARLLAVVVAKAGEAGRSYRAPTKRDLEAAQSASAELLNRAKKSKDLLSVVPDEVIPTERPSPNARGLSAVTRMGVRTFGDLYSPRQALALATLSRLVGEVEINKADEGLSSAVRACLALAVDRVSERCCSLARWDSSSKMETVAGTFGRQALPIVWDFAEQVPLRDVAGNWKGAIEWIALVIDNLAQARMEKGTADQASATKHPLPDGAASALITDPPYYDSVPYADLSDYFYVWLKRSLRTQFPTLTRDPTAPKDEEAIWNPSRIYAATGKPKDEAFYESQMAKALSEGRRITSQSGIAVVVFAHKSTAGWEAILSALLNAGWVATASWPIDTEMGTRVNAVGTASLASSVHIVCRPRLASDAEQIGDWRDVLEELPRRIHDWLPRLASEGVVGADAIFACLGPALEVFSRYARVEKASGAVVSLKEYLEHVWAAVAKEALAMIFAGVDATGFEEDARLTAMWLWTLSTANQTNDESSDDASDEDDDDESSGSPAPKSGFVLEFDAARKIAQGLGAHLESLTSLVEIKGSSARLLAAAERTRPLFGKVTEKDAGARKKKKSSQLSLGFEAELEDAEEGAGWSDIGGPPKGATVLDRVHQAMILFGAGRGEALKRFLVDDGVGREERFWRLSQALSALYPSATDEKRWVDGLLARKKGLGY